MKRYGFFQDSDGNNSSGRLLGFIVAMWALALCTTIIIMGYIQAQPIIMVAAAAGTLFTSVAGPALYFMFNNKKTEVYKDINTQPTQQSS